LAWSEGRRLFGSVQHSSNQPDELSQWLHHNDSTINCVLVDILIIIIVSSSSSSSTLSDNSNGECANSMLKHQQS